MSIYFTKVPDNKLRSTPKPGDHTDVSAVTLVIFLAAALFGGAAVQAQALAQDIYRINDGTFANHVEYHKVELEPGKEVSLGELPGAGKVTYFYFTDGNAFGGLMHPGLVLKVYWDGAAEPSIRDPLWNFFGAFGRTSIDYQSLVMQINHYCYMSYLPMPFSKGAHFAPHLLPYAQRIAPSNGVNTIP